MQFITMVLHLQHSLISIQWAFLKDEFEEGDGVMEVCEGGQYNVDVFYGCEHAQ